MIALGFGVGSFATGMTALLRGDLAWAAVGLIAGAVIIRCSLRRVA